MYRSSARRLVLGLSSLALVLGLVAAVFAPGGWLSDWRPGMYRTDGIAGQVIQINLAVGFEKGTYIPLIGLGLALLGAIGVAIGWALRAPALPSEMMEVRGAGHDERQ